MARSRIAPPLASPDDIEQQFYEALQRGDIERLMAVWSDDEEIRRASCRERVCNDV